MREEIRRMFCEYPLRITELQVLELQLSNFQGVDGDEVIQSTCFASSKGDRVQTSGHTDRTAKVAISYRRVKAQMDDEYFDYLMEHHRQLREELDFFTSGINSLSGILPNVIGDLVIEGINWQGLMEKYQVSHAMIGKYRKKALEELEEFYRIRDRHAENFMLS